MAEDRLYGQILEELRNIKADNKERGKRVTSALSGLREEVIKLTGLAESTQTRCGENKVSIESLEDTVNEHSLALVRITTVSGFQQEDLKWMRGKIWWLLGFFTAGAALGALASELIP